MNNYDKYLEIKKKYNEIIYKSYNINENENEIIITYNYIIPQLTEFNPTIKIKKNIIENKKINKDLLNDIVFNIGMIELISYYKAICCEKIIIEAGYLNEEEKEWYKKLYINGLSEMLYRNGIPITNDLFNFEVKGKEVKYSAEYKGVGNIIPVGGGKDSVVTLELLKNESNKCFIINPKFPSIKCCEIANYEEKNICAIERQIDKNLIELNKQGFLNGHTPFSAIVAFTSLLIAYLTNSKNIILSNEDSANEETVLGTNVNHQYSKSYEFEKDFDEYVKKHFNIEINYFSLLRPIKEIQIAMLFSKFKEYHYDFRSCNLGSKEKEWKWCCKCPKCLFVFIILAPFINEKERVKIFGENLLEKQELEESFIELIGVKESKPFECVGTIEEVKYSLNCLIKKGEKSYLLNLYKEKFYDDVEIDLTNLKTNEHNVPENYYSILKGAITKCTEK